MNQEAENSPCFEALPAGHDIFVRVEELVQAYRRGDPFGLITVVVPSNYSSFYLRRRLAPGGYFNVELTRLDDLAEKIGGSQDDRTPLTRLQAAALVYSAAMSAPPGSRIGPIRSHPSLHAALRSTFRQLEALDQDPVPLLRRESELVREVAAVYRTYRQSRRELARTGGCCKGCGERVGKGGLSGGRTWQADRLARRGPAASVCPARQGARRYPAHRFLLG